MLVSHQHWIKVLTINNYLVANLALIRKHSFYLFYFTLFYFIILYWFCHTSTWVRHRCTCVPNPEPPSHFSPHTISLGYPSAPAPSILYPASNLDWRFVSYMILYMFQCHSSKSSHPLPLPIFKAKERMFLNLQKEMAQILISWV